MRIWVLICFPLLLHGASLEEESTTIEESSLSISPLIPLTPPFPLLLSPENRESFINDAQIKEKEKKTIHHYLHSHTFPWPALLTFIACGWMAWLGRLIYERWPEKKKQIPLLTAKEEIIQALHDLKNPSLSNGDSFYECYIQLHSLLFKTLSTRLHWKKEMTSIEIAKELKKAKEIPANDKAFILAFLKETDLVKFAGLNPSQESAEESFNKIREFAYSSLSLISTD